MLLHVLLYLLASQTLGIKPSPRRHRRSADKRPILFKQIETRGVDPDIVSQLLIFWVLAGCQRLIESQSLGITLPPEDIFQAF